MIRSASTRFFITKRSQTAVFLLSLFVLAYGTFISYVIVDVYEIEVVGELVELLWLPMLALLVLLPGASIIQILKSDYRQKSLPLASLLVGAATILALILK